MDRGNEREKAEQADGEVGTPNQRTRTFRFPTSTGVVVVDPEGFIGDVINSHVLVHGEGCSSDIQFRDELSIHRLLIISGKRAGVLKVNDFTIDGFNSMEEFAAQTLNLESEEDRRALKLGVDSIYHKVQDNIDESFTRWEGICRDRYFNFSVDPQTISSFENTDVHKNSSNSPCVEDIQKQAVDVELSSIRSQLIDAHREGAKMRRELTSLEKQLTLRKEVLSDVKSLEETFDGAVLEEVIKSASLLKDTILKASSFQGNNFRQQVADPSFEGKNFDLSIPHYLDGRDAAIDKLLG